MLFLKGTPLRKSMGEYMADLITLAEYKAYAGLNTPNQDAQIAALIPGICQYVETYCNRKFKYFLNEPFTEVFSGKNYPIQLKHHPVTAVISVEESLDYGATYTGMEEFVQWVLDKEEGTIVAPAGLFSSGINRYGVTYNYGFEVLPEDLKLAIFDLVKYYMRNDMAVHSNKAPGTSIVQLDYQTNASIPGHIRRILDLYKVDYV
jgi:hypothetical protein